MIGARDMRDIEFLSRRLAMDTQTPSHDRFAWVLFEPLRGTASVPVEPAPDDVGWQPIEDGSAAGSAVQSPGGMFKVRWRT